MRRMWKWAKRLAIALAVLVGGAVVLTLAAMVVLDTARGREWARPRIEALVSRSIPGAIRIGRIERATLGRIALRDFVVLDPHGREVLRVGELEARPAVRALARRVIRLRDFIARDVTATLTPSDVTGLTLLDAFDDGAEDEPPDEAAGGTVIRVDRFRIERGVAHVELEGLPLELRDVAIEGNLRSSDHLELAVTGASLRVEARGAVIGQLRLIEAVYRTAPGARSEARAVLEEAEDRLRVRVAMTSPDAPPEDDAPSRFEVALEIERLTPRVIAALGQAELAKGLPESMRGRVEAQGTEERATFRVVANTVGSTIRLDGVYQPRDTRMQLCVAQLAMRRLYASLPAATVDGCARAGFGDFTEEAFPARLELRGATYDQTRIPDLRVEGIVETEAEALAIRSLDLPNAEPRGEDRLNVEGRITGGGGVDLELVARDFDPSADPALAALLGDFGGVIDASGELRMTPAPSRVEASLLASIDALVLPGVRALDVSLKAEAEGPTEAPRFEVEGRARRIAIGGYEVRRPRLRANGTDEAAAVSAVGRLEGGERVAMRLRATRDDSLYAVDGAGTLGGRDERFRFRLTGLTYDGERERGELRALRIAHDGGRALVRGTLDGDEVDAIVRVDRMPIDALARGLAPEAGEVEGKLSGVVELGGSTGRPVGSLELRLEDAEGFGFEDVEAGLSARLGPTDASLRGRIDTRRSGSLTIAGNARFPERPDFEEALRLGRYEIRAEVDTNALDGELGALWHDEGLLAVGALVDVDGRFAEVTLRSAATPEALRGELDPLAFPLDLDVELFERTIARLPVRRPSWLSGELRVGGSFSLTSRPRRPLEGELHARLRGDLGPMAAPEDDCGAVGAITLLLDGTLAGDRARATLDASLEGERPRAHLELAANVPLARILRGRAGPEAIVADLVGRIADLELETLPVLCEMGAGTVSAEIVASDLGRPDADLRVTSTMRGARLGPRATFDVDAELRARQGAATAHLAMESDVGGSARVEAMVPFSFGADGRSPAIGDGEIAIRSRFDRLTLEPFAPVSRFVRGQAGTLDGSVEITGTSDAPMARGALELDDSTVVVPGFDQRLSDLEARVRFSPGYVAIEELHARDLDGSLSLRARATLDGLVPQAGSIELETEDFPVRQEGVVTATVDSRARGKVARGDDGLRGELRFESLAVRIPDESGRDLQDLDENPDIIYVDAYPEGWDPPPREVDRGEAEDPSAEPSLAERIMPFEIHIDASEPFWIRRSDLSVLLAAELDFVVAPGKSELTGEVRTLRGHVELVGSRFELAEGTIRFVGGETIDPLLDVTALANADTAAEVRVSITGPLSAPVLAFADRSGQELTAGAALACITTSRCDPRATTAAGSGADADTLAQQARGQLASLTAGLLSTLATQGLGKKLPRISVSAGESIEDVTVSAGFQANRLIPKVLRKIVNSLYIEGYVGTESVAEDAGAAASTTSTRATGGFLIELRHPHRVVSRGRYEPPASWSLDLTWQP